MSLSILDDIVDPQHESYEKLLVWINQRLDSIRSNDFSSDDVEACSAVELREDFTGCFGPEGHSVWRRFFLAVLMADWACYEAEVNRADFARLKYIMTSSYKYFRLWMCRLTDGTMAPVGYTAWYPISKAAYECAMNVNADINDRGMFMPLRFANEECIHYAYAFNVSIIKQLRNTKCSSRLVRAYQKDGKAFKHIGAVAVTVDEPGKKFSRIGGFARVRDISVMGEIESIFVRKPA